MLVCLRRITPLVACLFACAHLQAEVLVRWDRNDVPSRDSLGVAALVIPATNASAVRTAIAHGFGVYLEVEASTLGRFAVTGGATPPVGALIAPSPAPAGPPVRACR